MAQKNIGQFRHIFGPIFLDFVQVREERLNLFVSQTL